MRMDRKDFVYLVFIAAFGLCFYFGLLTQALGVFPASYFKQHFAVVTSVADYMDRYDYAEKVRWHKKAPLNLGVSVRQDELIEHGYTLIAGAHDSTLRLIDVSGEVKHEWSFQFNEDWLDRSHVVALSEVEDWFFFARDFYLYDNGDLLVMAAAAGITPWGMGLVMLDKDSNVKWTYSGYNNNDFQVSPDGVVYAIEHLIRTDGINHGDYQETSFLEDNIALIDPETGEVTKRYSLINAIENSDYKDFLHQLRFRDDHSGDPTHSNSITIISDDVETVPWLRKGYLAISIRNNDAMAILNPENGELVHLMELRSRMQHDLDYLGNGHFLVFDNQGSFKEGGFSRVFEFDAITNDIVWKYEPAPIEGKPLFESQFWGEQQRLNNGNTLIVHADAGRLIEVLPNGEIVWEYYHPLTREREGVDYIATITMAERIEPHRLSFLAE